MDLLSEGVTLFGQQPGFLGGAPELEVAQKNRPSLVRRRSNGVCWLTRYSFSSPAGGDLKGAPPSLMDGIATVVEAMPTTGGAGGHRSERANGGTKSPRSSVFPVGVGKTPHRH